VALVHSYVDLCTVQCDLGAVDGGVSMSPGGGMEHGPPEGPWNGAHANHHSARCVGGASS